MSRLKKVLVIGAATVALVLTGTAAYAIVTVHTGTVTDQQQFINDTNVFATASAAFINVPTAVTGITLTSPHSIDARFTAESRCIGNAGWCSVRIVLLTSAGATIELDPVVGLDFAFDSVGSDGGEGHAIERVSALMPAGSYRVQVQAAVVGGGQVQLDDWTLAVEAVRP